MEHLKKGTNKRFFDFLKALDDEDDSQEHVINSFFVMYSETVKKMHLADKTKRNAMQMQMHS